ncbi:hypothetical protein D7Z54_28750 [Salibacterium salarium]|uniref:Uncharacterized protein n=1 Tax=Salibacterium salarium TaxID=284579 RepID=A0A3R9QGD4_9BACI|nr:hypothetical protein [Salibacterium salarium]RSL29929.1 hypothetical protein D7Z54_28750 [Salibacterium salarium]
MFLTKEAVIADKPGEDDGDGAAGFGMPDMGGMGGMMLLPHGCGGLGVATGRCGFSLSSFIQDVGHSDVVHEAKDDQQKIIKIIKEKCGLSKLYVSRKNNEIRTEDMIKLTVKLFHMIRVKITNKKLTKYCLQKKESGINFVSQSTLLEGRSY